MSEMEVELPLYVVGMHDVPGPLRTPAWVAPVIVDAQDRLVVIDEEGAELIDDERFAMPDSGTRLDRVEHRPGEAVVLLSSDDVGVLGQSRVKVPEALDEAIKGKPSPRAQLLAGGYIAWIANRGEKNEIFRALADAFASQAKRALEASELDRVVELAWRLQRAAPDEVALWRSYALLLAARRSAEARGLVSAFRLEASTDAPSLRDAAIAWVAAREQEPRPARPGALILRAERVRRNPTERAPIEQRAA